MGDEHPSPTVGPDMNQPIPQHAKRPSPAQRLLAAQQLRNLLKHQQKGK